GECGRASRFIVGRVQDGPGRRGDAQADERSGGGCLSDLQRGGPVTVGGRQAVGGEVRHRRLADAVGKGALIGGARRDDRRGIVRHGEGGRASRFIVQIGRASCRERGPSSASSGSGRGKSCQSYA